MCIEGERTSVSLSLFLSSTLTFLSYTHSCYLCILIYLHDLSIYICIHERRHNKLFIFIGGCIRSKECHSPPLPLGGWDEKTIGCTEEECLLFFWSRQLSSERSVRYSFSFSSFLTLICLVTSKRTSLCHLMYIGFYSFYISLSFSFHLHLAPLNLLSQEAQTSASFSPTPPLPPRLLSFLASSCLNGKKPFFLTWRRKRSSWWWCLSWLSLQRPHVAGVAAGTGATLVLKATGVFKGAPVWKSAAIVMRKQISSFIGIFVLSPPPSS